MSQGSGAEQILELALRLHRARLLVVRLKKERRALQCERERRLVPNTYDTWTGTEPAPCWKYTVEVDIGVGSALEPTAGPDSEQWCATCQKRQAIHEQLVVAKPAAGDLKREFWRRLTKLDKEAARLAAKE